MDGRRGAVAGILGRDLRGRLLDRDRIADEPRAEPPLRTEQCAARLLVGFPCRAEPSAPVVADDSPTPRGVPDPVDVPRADLSHGRAPRALSRVRRAAVVSVGRRALRETTRL